MEQEINEDKSIFVHLDQIDDMAWTDSCSNTNLLLITANRDDTFSIRSKTKYKNVAHLFNYELNQSRVNLMVKSEIETVVLLPIENYDGLAISLINNGFTIKVLEMKASDIININTNDLCKYISRSKQYYSFWFENLSKQNDFITNPSSLEIELSNLIYKLDFAKLDHVQFNNFLINMIQLENLGEPLLFNFLKKAIINTYNNNKMENK